MLWLEVSVRCSVGLLFAVRDTKENGVYKTTACSAIATPNGKQHSRKSLSEQMEELYSKKRHSHGKPSNAQQRNSAHEATQPKRSRAFQAANSYA